MKEVVAIRSTLRRRMDLFIGIGLKEIIYLVWAIFLDSREFFTHQIEDTDDLPDSQLWYTTNFLGIGRIPTGLLRVPLSQFLVAAHPQLICGGGNGGGSSNSTRLRQASARSYFGRTSNGSTLGTSRFCPSPSFLKMTSVDESS
jgi:hypothetical protein